MRARNHEANRTLAASVAVLAILTLAVFAAPAQAGRFDKIRSDAHDEAPKAAPVRQSEAARHGPYHDEHSYEDHEGSWLLWGLLLGAPFYGPPLMLDDDYSLANSFPQFPYDDASGYPLTPRRYHEYDDLLPPQCPTRHWAARVRFEYADDFDDLTRTSGHLLLTTATRFGLDTEAGYLREELPSGSVDDLAIGDCNLVFRFGQHERAQFRTGLGFNWLDDPIDTNFGFNFTYGADFFPAKPWVVSSTIDWGTLGDASLFRFRLTSGVIVNRYEAYTGYEYLDLGQSEIGSLVAGVRVWF